MTRVAKALVYDNDGYALVLWRSDTHPHYPLEADLPGGIVESGESYVHGLLRELREEVGIELDAEQAMLIARAKYLVYGEKHLYEIRLADRPEPTISWEHERYEWVEPERLLEVLESRDDYMAFVRKTLAHRLKKGNGHP